MIRTVIFDLGNVLIPFDFKIGYQQMSDHCGLPPDEIRSRLREARLHSAFESGEMDEYEFQRRVEAVLETEVPYDKFCGIWSSVFFPDPNIPESMVEGIHRHHRTVLLSNTNPIHYRMLRRTYPVLNHFDAYILSHEVQAMKPLPRIYEAAIAAAECAAGECFFTDDIPEYVEGAKRQGIDAVQFESREQIERELQARGIRW